ncbi:hypothetical protein AB4Z52_13735 [Rhizobium sp. 2YAF20]|jgi:hypothetical protein
MQIRPWLLGLAVFIAGVAFFATLTVPLTGQAPLRGMQPPQTTARH